MSILRGEFGSARRLDMPLRRVWDGPLSEQRWSVGTRSTNFHSQQMTRATHACCNRSCT